MSLARLGEFMYNKFIAVIAVISCFLTTPSIAGGYFGGKPEGTPSVFTYGWDGLKLGLLTGLSIGYIEYARSKDSRALGNGAAYGAIFGTGVGLMLGMRDVSQDRKGMGAIIMADMQKGGNLGFVVGALVGVAQTINGGKAEAIGEGAAWGFLAGEVAGFFIASYEGPVIMRDYSSNIPLKVVMVSDSSNNLIPGIGLYRKF